MSNREIRFGVADQNGYRASTWKCVTPKSADKLDVYLICRELGGSLKISLHEKSLNQKPHEHGLWRIAYLRDFYYKNTEALKNQVIDEWPRPLEIGSGMTLAFRILTPAGAVTTPLNGSAKKTHWIRAPMSGEVIETCIIITSPTTKIRDWPGKNAMNSNLVGFISLNDRGKVWVVYRGIKMPELKEFPTKTTVRFFQGHSVKKLEKSKNLRMHVFGRMEDGSRAIIEFGCKIGGKD